MIFYSSYLERLGEVKRMYSAENHKFALAEVKQETKMREFYLRTYPHPGLVCLLNGRQSGIACEVVPELTLANLRLATTIDRELKHEPKSGRQSRADLFPSIPEAAAKRTNLTDEAQLRTIPVIQPN